MILTVKLYGFEKNYQVCTTNDSTKEDDSTTSLHKSLEACLEEASVSMMRSKSSISLWLMSSIWIQDATLVRDGNL